MLPALFCGYTTIDQSVSVARDPEGMPIRMQLSSPAALIRNVSAPEGALHGSSMDGHPSNAINQLILKNFNVGITLYCHSRVVRHYAFSRNDGSWP